MKKILVSTALTLSLILTLAACGDQAQTGDDSLPSDSQTLTAVDPAEVPESMVSFLNWFYPWYYDEENTRGGEYHSDSAADGTSNIVSQIAGEAPCVDLSLYPGEQPEYITTGLPDPRGWWTQAGAYTTYDVSQVDWIAQNIFHVSDEDLAQLKTQGEADGWFYIQNGCYYTTMGGLGDPFLELEITQAATDGQRYYLAYEVYFTGTSDGTRELQSTRYAVLSEETIDGTAYCTMYSNGASALEELTQTQQPAGQGQGQEENPQTQEPSDNWSAAYQAFIFQKGWLGTAQGADLGSDSEAVVFLLHDMDNDGVPELLARNEVVAFGEMSNYVYTWDDGEVVFLGEIGFLGGALWPSDTDDYPGLFHYAGRGDSYMGHYYDLKNGQIHETLVSNDIMVPSGDSFDFESTIETSDADLYMTYSRTKNSDVLPMYTADEISAMGWEAFTA